MNKETALKSWPAVQVFCRGNNGRIGRQRPMTSLSVFTMLQDEDGGVRGLGGSNQSRWWIVYVHLRDEFLHIVRDLEHL